jgi:1-aminocyclopropane-1-carboxylate synthase
VFVVVLSCRITCVLLIFAAISAFTFLTMGFISSRARDNLKPNKAFELVLYAFANQYDPVTNPDGIVALAVAENKLMHQEVSEYINKHFEMTPWMLTYGDGFTGSTALKKALAKFINIHFTPRKKIDESAICLTNGVGSAVDNLAFCIGEPGDGVLIGRPLYVGFVPDLAARAKCVMPC